MPWRLDLDDAHDFVVKDAAALVGVQRVVVLGAVELVVVQDLLVVGVTLRVHALDHAWGLVLVLSWQGALRLELFQIVVTREFELVVILVHWTLLGEDVNR